MVEPTETVLARVAALEAELAAAKRAAADAVEQQTTTAAILSVISDSAMFRSDGHVIDVVAHTRAWKLFGKRFRSLGQSTMLAQVIHEGIVLEDVQRDGTPTVARSLGKALGFRGMLNVPMMLNDVVIGVISVVRDTAGSFSVGEIDLLRTLADQTVIAKRTSGSSPSSSSARRS